MRDLTLYVISDQHAGHELQANGDVQVSRSGLDLHSESDFGLAAKKAIELAKAM